MVEPLTPTTTLGTLSGLLSPFRPLIALTREGWRVRLGCNGSTACGAGADLVSALNEALAMAKGDGR